MEAQDTLDPLRELETICNFKKFSIGEFEIINEFNECAFEGVEMEHAIGNFKSKVCDCRIIIIKGPILKILPYIRTLLIAYDSVKESPLFCEVLGYFVDSDLLDKVKFGLVFINYELNILFIRL